MKRLRAGLAAVMAGATLPLGAAQPAGAATGDPAIGLVSQTPYVVGHGVFSLKIDLAAPDPAADQLQVLGFPQVITRTDFDSAAKGKVNSYADYAQKLPLSRLSGELDIPVDEPAAPGSEVTTWSVSSGSGGGVFPLQLQLRGPNGELIGDPLTTFLVWAAAPQATLSAAVVVPFASSPRIGPTGQPAGPTGAEADRLDQLAAALNADSSAHAGVVSDPLLLSGLRAGAQAGSDLDRRILANLAGTPQDGLIEVMPATYSPVDIGALQQAGLGPDVDAQLAAGAQVLSEVYGAAPSSGTWVVNGPLDGATLAALADRHVSRLIVPDGDLTPLRAPYTQLTFAEPTGLDYGNVHLTVLAADPGLTADFNADGSPVLAANRLLAEMAMIQSEQPSKARTVAAVPPPGWQASPAFVTTLLGGLAGNPLVQSATPTSVFASGVPADLSRQLSDPGGQNGPPAENLTGDASGIQKARGQIDAISSVLPAQSAVSTTALRLAVLVAESSVVTEAQRDAILSSIGAAARRVIHGIALPPAGSVTLTATRGVLPVTILTAPSLRARVELRLISQRLIFQPFKPPDGSCVVPTLNREICTLSLSTQNTTLKVPVQTRSSGVFPLDVSLYSPGGAIPLGHNRDTVRSTAVSGVGVVLIVVALVSLLVWWGRDLRHGRRARRLVPSPVAEPDAPDIVLSQDPVVHQFFTRPAPEYKPDGNRQIG